MPVSNRVPTAVHARALAKINLTLRVIGVHPDGYHELRTTFQSLALHDVLSFTRTEGAFTIECDAPGVPLDRSNLVWRAAEALWRISGRRGRLTGVRVRIAKRIPMQAGLGGGSSDAAATLRALNALWRVEGSASDLCGIGSRLGADVPYFLAGGTMLGVNRGDVLFPLVDRPRASVVLVSPDFGVSTKQAYAWWDADAGTARRSRRSVALTDGLPACEWINDLEGPVARRHPSIARLARQLRRLGAAHAAMSGSGSTLFGLFEDRMEAREAALRLSRPGLRTIVTATANRAQFLRLSRPSKYRPR
jgi:4-diphosphocytidyl-2-C-methyl-D-erythritol kinase